MTIQLVLYSFSHIFKNVRILVNVVNITYRYLTNYVGYLIKHLQLTTVTETRIIN